MKQVLRITAYVLLLALAAYLIWRFSFIIVWVLIAAIISFIGAPLMKFFSRLHIRRWHFPKTLSAVLTLSAIVIVSLGLFAIFVPLIVQQANTISHIDINQVTANLQGPMHWLDEQMHRFGFVPNSQSLQDFVLVKAKSFVSFDSISGIINSFFGVAGSVLVGIFSVLFIAFFFIKDETLFEDSLLLMIPVKHHQATRRVISDSKNLLMRYFIGLLFELLGVMSLITLGLTIFGVKNALLIGFFGGLMNIIPYLGPVVGTIIGLILGLTDLMSTGAYNELLPLTIKLLAVFIIANYIDNLVLQPLIYSSSVKAHPLEIFLVIVMGGSLGGIFGMLFAIPVYTVLRVIAKEFFQKFRVVRKLTEKIDSV